MSHIQAERPSKNRSRNKYSALVWKNAKKISHFVQRVTPAQSSMMSHDGLVFHIVCQ